MQKLKSKILYLLFVIAMLVSFGASDFVGNNMRAIAASVPEFPMSFYGTVTIDDAVAPVGAVIRAYNASSTLLGEVMVNEVGIYGYDNPIKQRLILKEATGTITFKFKTESKNAGAETAGTVTQDYASYTAGLTIKKDIAFKTTGAAPANSGGGGGGGGSSGGGGGGGGSYIAPTINVNNTKVATNTVINTKVATNTATAITEIKFTKTLALGSKNDEVLAMQKILIAQKLLTATSANGYFGPATQKALKAWQKKNKLQTTGITGPVTRELLAKQSKK